MKWTIENVFFLLILPMLLSGCLNLKQPVSKIEYYTLEYSASPIKGLKTLPHTIKIERFTAAPAYNTGQIIYRDRSFKRNAYIYHRWRAHPSDFVASMLTRDIRDSGLFKAVLSADSSFPSSYVMEGVVDECFEWDNQDKWEAILSLSIVLMEVDSIDGRHNILFQKSYRKRKICERKNTEALAAAMSLAMSEISEAIIKDVYAFLK